MASPSKDDESSPFIPASSEDTSEDTRPSAYNHVRFYDHRRIWLVSSVSLFVGVVLTSALWLIIWCYSSRAAAATSSPHAPSVTTSCGWNHSSAIANNCKFQLWSYSWVPRGCYDQTLDDEFLALHVKEGWHYYTDPSSWQEVPLDTVLAGTRNDLYSTWGQHYWHCAFYQRKFFRVVANQGDEARASSLKMTNRDMEEHHAIHCQEWLANPMEYPWDKINIKLTVGYHFCS